MLNKRYRFHSRGGVNWVYKHGKTVRSVQASLVFAPNERGFTRVAVVVSKKVDKTAVGRNRIRRRVYEVIRKNFEYLPKKTDYIFIIYSLVNNLSLLGINSFILSKALLQYKSLFEEVLEPAISPPTNSDNDSR